MIRQSTIDKLHDLRLSAMSDAFECQCRDPETYQGLSFEDRFGMLVDKEWDKRKSTKLQKLIRSAEFRYPNACMEDIEYHPDRNLDKGQMLEFSTCRYISDDHHIILKGASRNGKTYIACALGIAACRNFIKVRYVRLPDLLNELAVAHGDGTLKKVIKAYQKIDLLILDEFLLSPVSTEQMFLISQFVTNQICSHVTDLPSFVSLAFLYNPADFLPDYLFHLQCYI